MIAMILAFLGIQTIEPEPQVVPMGWEMEAVWIPMEVSE